MLDSDYESRVMRLVKACAYQLKAVAGAPNGKVLEKDLKTTKRE